MRNWKQRPNRIVLLIAASTIASLASSAHAAAVAVTKYAVIQPIDVCSTNGTSGGCAPFNTSSQSPDPTTATSTTPIGWVDTQSNINLTREIWLQAGIDVTFLPMLQYNNSTYQSIDVNCSGNCSQLGSNAFMTLTTSPGPAAASGCVSNCLVPIYASNYAYAKANAIPMFFINSITPASGSGLTGTYFGFGWVNGAGVAVAKPTYFPTFPDKVHFDTMAHELGHNLGIDHCTFGAGADFAGVSKSCGNITPIPCPSLISSTGGVPNPGGCNVMNAGDVRILAAKTDCTPQSTDPTKGSTGGELWDLNTGTFLSATLCAAQTLGNVTIADALVPTQTSQALLSGFLNTQPNVSATAGGGKAAATTAATTAATACPFGSVLTFCVTNNSSNDIAALVISVPNNFNFTSPQFQYVSGPVPQSVEVLHGNTGAGNNNCQKALPIASASSFQCLEIDFLVRESSPFTHTFRPGDTLVFSSNIHTISPGGSATLGQLACTTPIPQGCLDITEVFDNLYATTAFFDQSGQASSLSPDPTVPSTIVDPAFFPTLANLSPPPTFSGSPNPVTGGLPAPCAPKNNGKCPPLAGGDAHGSSANGND